MSDPIIEATRDRLLRFKGRYPEVCERADLQYSWLSKFARSERGKRPSYDHITKLQRALTSLEDEAVLVAQHREKTAAMSDG